MNGNGGNRKLGGREKLEILIEGLVKAQDDSDCKVILDDKGRDGKGNVVEVLIGEYTTDDGVFTVTIGDSQNSH